MKQNRNIRLVASPVIFFFFYGSEQCQLGAFWKVLTITDAMRTIVIPGEKSHYHLE